ncbi:MAG TPA: TonB family protein [Terriglobales bacterium]|nr:TonB family protein [Terriglobales bacterium]
MGSAQGQGTSELEQARTAPEFGAHTPLSEKLLAVAIRAQNFTGSTGVAIALTEGQEMVCRANWGTSAPEVGATLSIEHSFTGLCVRTGEPLRCDDAQSDPRVDPEACQALGISAIAAAPVRRGLKVIGVIAAFSDTPNAFTDKHLLILTTLSDVIVEILDDPHPVQSLSQTFEAAPDLARAAAVAQAPLTLPLDKAAVTAVVSEPPAPPAEAAPVAESVAPAEPVQPEPPATATPLPPPEPTAPLPEQIKTGFPPPPSKDRILEDPEVAGPPVVPVMPGSSPPAPIAAQPKASGLATPRDSASDLFEAPAKKDEVLPAAMDPGPPLQQTKTGSPPQRSKIGSSGAPGLPPQQTKAESARNSGPPPQQTKTGFPLQGSKDRLVGDLGLAGGPAPTRLSLVKQPASMPAPDFGAGLTFSGLEVDAHSRRRWLLPAAVLAIFAVIAVAGWRLHVAREASMAKHVPAAPAPQSTPTPQPEQAQEAKAPEPAAAEPEHSPFSPPPIANIATLPAKARPEEAPADVTIRRGPQPVVEAAGPLRRPATGTSRAAQVPEAQAPQLVLSAPELPAALARPAPAEVAGPVSRILPARLIQRVEPVYPETARRLQISGKVVVKATITRSGTVGGIQWVSGNDLFRESAITAVKQWRYKAASLNGQPVESDLEVVLHFNRPTNQ